MNALAADLTSAVILLGLVCLRMAPLTMVPFFAGRAPWMVRAAFVVAMSLFAWAAILPGAPLTFGGSPYLGGLALKELGVGVVMALMLSVVFWGVEMGGRTIDVLRGQGSLAGPQQLLSRGGGSGSLVTVGAIAVLVLAGGHLLALRVVLRSFVVVPVGAMPGRLVGGLALPVLVETSGELFVLCVSVALPVVIAVWVVEFILAVVARSMPEVNMFFVGLPARGLAGVVALLVAFGVIVQVATERTEVAASSLMAVLHAVAQGP